MGCKSGRCSLVFEVVTVMFVFGLLTSLEFEPLLTRFDLLGST